VCNFLLNGEDVVQLAIKGLRPETVTILRSNQLRRNAEPISRFANTTFQYASHPERRTDLGQSSVLALECK
jgi:hypothetical protein